VHPGGRPRVLGTDRRGEARERGGRRAAGTRRARGSQQDGAEGHGGSQPAPRRDRELSGGKTENFDIINNPEDPSAGVRSVPFSRELFIERDDFREDPPKKFFRLPPGREVRLRGAYFVTCTGVVTDADGHVTELRCTYDPATRGGDASDGRRVKATLHWVSAGHALEVEVRLYDRLFKSELPDSVDYLADLNPVSLDVVTGARVEPSVLDAAAGTRYQFERLGYFCVDPDSAPGKMVFNRTVTLKDTWARIERRG